MEVVAYFDPSAGSLVLQALLGGSAGVIVFLRFIWNSCVRNKPPKT